MFGTLILCKNDFNSKHVKKKLKERKKQHDQNKNTMLIIERMLTIIWKNEKQFKA